MLVSQLLAKIKNEKEEFESGDPATPAEGDPQEDSKLD